MRLMGQQGLHGRDRSVGRQSVRVQLRATIARIAEDDLIRAEIVFFETPSGGAVFSTGSIAWCGSLSHNGYDNNVSRLTGNVLRRFMNDAPFSLPQEA